MSGFPSVKDITSDSKYLGGALVLGVSTYLSPLRPFLPRILAAHFVGHIVLGRFLGNVELQNLSPARWLEGAGR
jgi:hypothetical protein